MCSCDDAHIVSFTTETTFTMQKKIRRKHHSSAHLFLCFADYTRRRRSSQQQQKNKNNKNNKKRREKKKRHRHHHENGSDDGKAQKTLFFLLPSPLVVDGILRAALLFFVWRRGSGENAETIRGHGTSDGGTTRRSSFRATEEEQRVG
jgi:hypothetical protein